MQEEVQGCGCRVQGGVQVWGEGSGVRVWGAGWGEGSGVRVWGAGVGRRVGCGAHISLLQTGGRKKCRFPSTQLFTLTGHCIVAGAGTGQDCLAQAWLISVRPLGAEQPHTPGRVPGAEVALQDSDPSFPVSGGPQAPHPSTG